MPRRTASIVLLGGALVGWGCGHERAPLAGNGPTLHGGDPDSGFLMLPPPVPPPADAGGLCGNLIVPVVVERPNLYFVIDASGSMVQPMDRPSASGILPTRYEAARLAIADLLRAVGHRVQYGAALFPARNGDPDAMCPAGEEVFATRPGDPVSYAISGEMGPILSGFFRTLAGPSPSGLTPTAATLVGLEDKLLALPGKTFVFLLTDGAPNCNVTATCGADACIPNLDGDCGGIAGVNCCDPQNGVADSTLCLDAEPTVAAVEHLAASGIQTFVVGMPGSDTTDAYAALLDRIAEAGQTARPTSPRYYPAQGADDLTQTLRQIGLSVTIDCDVVLETVPPEKGLVNVFLDSTVVPLDDENGWAWIADDHIRVVGEKCDQLKNGDALQLQVVAGCPTVVR